MTFEKKYLIETQDVIAVHYECAKCGGAIVVPVDKLDRDRAAAIAMSACFHCQTATGFQPNTNEITAFTDFNIVMKHIAKVMTGRNLKLRLEIKAPE